MIPKRLESITFEDIEALVSNSVAEGRTIDFKRKLPGQNKDDAREFLADVTSFANTNGGDLVFGVEEVQSIATAICGLEEVDRDKDLLRLEQMLAASVEPRIAGVAFHWVEGPGGETVLVVRAPSSLAAPHRVTHTGHDKFYGRHSKGKYPMDTHELRLAFTASEGLPARLRALHEQARSYARGEEFPLRLTSEGPIAVVSIMPLSILRQPNSIPVDTSSAIWPPRIESVSFLRTLEGIIAYSPLNQEGDTWSWSLLHEKGRLDVAWLIGSRDTPYYKDVQLIWPDYFEQGILEQCIAARDKFGAAGVDGPWVVFASIEGLLGYRLAIGEYSQSKPSWLSYGRLPELITDDLNEESLRPLVEQFWLMFGVERPQTPLTSG